MEKGFSVKIGGKFHHLYCSRVLYNNTDLTFFLLPEGTAAPEGFVRYEVRELPIHTLAHMVRTLTEYPRCAFTREGAIAAIIAYHKQALNWDEATARRKTAEVVAWPQQP